MAEKEERILISTRHYSEETKMTHTDMFNEYSRQEAIERMAKAICQFEMMTVMHVCKDCDEECFDHLELEVVDKAEAALNALLEKGDEK